MDFLNRLNPGKIKWEWIFLGIAFLFGASIAFRSDEALIRYFNADDAYYYYQTALNAVRGNGISFDGIARSNGYHPLWMLVCVPVFALASISKFLPLRVLVVILSLLFSGSGYLVYRILLKYTHRTFSLLGLALWLFSLTIYRKTAMMGLESGISSFFLLLLFWLAVEWEANPKRSLWWVGAAALLALLGRLDNVFFVAILGLWLVLKNDPTRRAWVLFDLLAVAGSVVLASVLRLGLTHAYYTMVPAMEVMIVTAILTQLVLQFLAGAYQRDGLDGRSLLPLLARMGIASLISTGAVYLSLIVLIPDGTYSRLMPLLSTILFTLFSMGLRVLYALRAAKATPSTKSSIWAAPLEVIRAQDWKQIWRRGLAYFAPVFSGLGAFLVFNHFYFGVSMPISGQIKRWWSSIYTIYGQPASDSWTFFGLYRNGPWHFLFNALEDAAARISGWIGRPQHAVLSVLLIAALLLLMILAVWRRTQTGEHAKQYLLAPFAAGVFFHVANYTATGYIAMRGWYWGLESIFLLIGLVALIDALLGRWTQNRVGEWIVLGAVLLTSAALISGFIEYNLQRFPFRQETAYPQSLAYVAYLQENTEPGSVIGMTGSGMAGYFIEDRLVINLDGLINGVEYYEALRAGTIDQYLEALQIDYLYGNSYILQESEPYAAPLNPHLDSISDFQNIVLYRYLYLP